MDLKDLIAIKTLVDLADNDNENQRALGLDDEENSVTRISNNRPVRRYTPRPDYSHAGERLIMVVLLILFGLLLFVFFDSCIFNSQP